ncbi:hypothetical protein HPP05_21560 [Corallococcus exiguus]|uniref:hypothetical protein n=1 Tax=Corallococcus exiguus TaxID=83462 RepID=UPI001494BE47|nr:hypothetical protein [Corallococcus exiguus]NPC72347.1 hypothetical protein [Corallococcus exiguus]
MMQYQTRIPSLSNVTATHYTPGADHLYYTDVGTGEVWWMPVNPATQLASRSQVVAKGQQLNLNVFATTDIQWDTAGANLLAKNFARILPLSGVNSLAEITPASLEAANWASVSNNNSLPENGSSTTGRFYAVRINYASEYHYAKLRIYKLGTQTWMDWVTYTLSPNPYRVGAGLTDVRDLVVSEYETALYVTAYDASSGQHSVLSSPRTSSALSPYPEFSIQPQPITYQILDEPQQLVLDGEFVYVVDATTLWRISLTTQETWPVVTGFSNGKGLLLSSSGPSLMAYIAESTGKVFAVDISDYVGGPTSIPVSQPAYQLTTTQLGFLAWANPERSAFYVPLTDTREVARIDLLAGGITTEGTTPTAAPGPSSIEVFSDSTLYVACTTELGRFTRSITVSNVLLLGIGLIPFGYINNSEQNPSSPGPDDGKANTSSAPGYYFSGYPNLPFAGDLSLMLNHPLAWNSGVRFYSLKLKNLASGLTRSIVDTFYDFKWDAAAAPPRFNSQPTASTAGLFPIRDPAELWYNAYLAALVKTSTADNGHNVLLVDFYDANKQPIPNGGFSRLLFVDNTRCGVRLELPRVGSSTTPPAAGVYPVLECGCLAYVTKDDLVELDFVAWQPQGSGSYSLRVSGGGGNIPLLAQDGTVTPAPTLVSKTRTSANKAIRVGHILGNCDVANVTLALNVPSRVIDGFGWVNLGAYTSRSFTVIKGPISHTPWTEP